MKKLLALVVVLIMVGAASWAQGTNLGLGWWLHDDWRGWQERSKSDENAHRAFEYEGFVLGAARTMWWGQWLDLREITVEQMLTTVGKYLDDHPDEWGVGAEASVYHALQAVWPGKKAPTTSK
ncbi:MAG: hypothetical protein ABSG21_02190 [Spirochaetia bacterium]